MVWNLKQEKPQRQRRRSTHDVTESISTFTRRCKLYWRCQTSWARFNIGPMMASFLGYLETSKRFIHTAHSNTIVTMSPLFLSKTFIIYTFTISSSCLYIVWYTVVWMGSGGAISIALPNSERTSGYYYVVVVCLFVCCGLVGIWWNNFHCFARFLPTPLYLYYMYIY